MDIIGEIPSMNYSLSDGFLYEHWNMQILLPKDIAESQCCEKYRSSTLINVHHSKIVNEVWSKVVEWISNERIQLLREGCLSKRICSLISRWTSFWNLS